MIDKVKIPKKQPENRKSKDGQRTRTRGQAKTDETCTILRKLKINGDELMCCGGVCIFCSTSGALCYYLTTRATFDIDIVLDTDISK